MARPIKCRRVCTEPEYDGFIPNGIVSGDEIILTVDEYEVIRLVDLEKKTHVQSAAQMGISKTTVTEIYESARTKIADCIVNGKKLIISGGNYQICDTDFSCGNRGCCKTDKDTMITFQTEKGEHTMRIAVTYDQGEVFQHFGHTRQFKVYDIEDNKVLKEEVIDTNGQGHGALAHFLANGKIDVLICGGIGGGAQAALANAGIRLYGGVSGRADAAVAHFLAGKLDYNPNVSCSHHGHGESHNCGMHSCGEERLSDTGEE